MNVETTTETRSATCGDCSVRVRFGIREIVLCPKHRQTEALLKALEGLQRLAWGDVSGHSIEAYKEAKAIACAVIEAASPHVVAEEGQVDLGELRATEYWASPERLLKGRLSGGGLAGAGPFDEPFL